MSQNCEFIIFNIVYGRLTGTLQYSRARGVAKIFREGFLAVVCKKLTTTLTFRPHPLMIVKSSLDSRDFSRERRPEIWATFQEILVPEH